MAANNNCFALGNLVADPRFQYTPSGVPVCNIRIALNKRWTKDGQTFEKTTYLSLVAWNKTAELITQYFTKSKPIAVWYELEDAEAWIGKQDGQPHAASCGTITQWPFAGGSNGGEGGAGAPAAGGSVDEAPM